MCDNNNNNNHKFISRNAEKSASWQCQFDTHTREWMKNKMPIVIFWYTHTHICVCFYTIATWIRVIIIYSPFSWSAQIDLTCDRCLHFYYEMCSILYCLGSTGAICLTLCFIHTFCITNKNRRNFFPRICSHLCALSPYPLLINDCSWIRTPSAHKFKGAKHWINSSVCVQ